MAFRLSSACLAVAAVMVAAPTLARAQEPPPRPNFSDFSAGVVTPARTARTAVRLDRDPASVERSRPSILMTSLYASTAIVQGLDVHSTMRALDAGAVERNPLMSYLTARPKAFVAVKSGTAVGLIYAGRRLAKRSKKQAAIAMIAVNSAYMFVAVHNYRVASRLR